MYDFVKVGYNGKYYTVCRYRRKGKPDSLFVVDYSAMPKILRESKKWYNIGGKIGHVVGSNASSKSSRKINKGSKSSKKSKISYRYLQNLIANTSSKINHINTNTHDNRRANLRTDLRRNNRIPVVRTARTANRHILPSNSNIRQSDIPKYVHYSKPQSGHGEMFVIELTGNGKKYIWKSSSSRNISLEDKLVEIKQKLLDIAKTRPDLVRDKNILENYTPEQIKLMKEFNEIISRSSYGKNIIKANLMHIPEYHQIKANINQTHKPTRKYLKMSNTAIKTRRRHIDKLPGDSGIIPAMIPKHCYYQAATKKRGDAFVIDHYPGLKQRQWSTTTSRSVSTREKFRELLGKLKQIRRSKN